MLVWPSRRALYEILFLSQLAYVETISGLCIFLCSMRGSWTTPIAQVGTRWPSRPSHALLEGGL